MAAKIKRASAAQEVTLGAGGELPTEFQLFAPGENPNYNADLKGDPQPVFTPKSAQLLKADAARRGADYSMDIEHASINATAKAMRSDACDAMCWFQIDVRPDGSCWAVNVRWSDEGARRLRAKLQRYVSPVFLFHEDTGEVLEFVNCALTANPATYGAAPLVAAHRLARPLARATPAALALRRGKSSRMTPETLKKITDVIASQDGEAALALLPDLLAEEVAEGDPADPMADPTAAAAEPPKPDPGAPMADPTKDPAKNSVDVARLAKLEADLAALTAKNEALENTARCELVAELVKLGVETPATAWQAASKGQPRKPVARLAVESIAELRARVALLSKNAPRRLTPPEQSDDAPAYSPKVMAALAKMDPEQKARFERTQAHLARNRKISQ